MTPSINNYKSGTASLWWWFETRFCCFCFCYQFFSLFLMISVNKLCAGTSPFVPWASICFQCMFLDIIILTLLAEYEFDRWFHFFENKELSKNRVSPKTWWHHRDVIKCAMKRKVNQGPFFDINVWCNRSLKTKLHTLIVRQYSHLKIEVIKLKPLHRGMRYEFPVSYLTK